MRVYIFGAAGAGVTTLGQELAATLDVPYFDSDTYFWEVSDPPFTRRRSAVARNAALTHDLAQRTSWVLGGSLVGWGEGWPPPADLVVFLWLPPALRLRRLRQREHTRYGDVIFTDPSRASQYQAFLEWAAGYDDGSSGGSRTLANHTAWLGQLVSPVLDLRGDLSVAERMEAVLAELRRLR